MYKPPFTITNKMLSLSISITEKVGQINNYQSLKRMPILRKNNKIKSIHSSLAIEANSLSLNQVKDIIEGNTSTQNTYNTKFPPSSTSSSDVDRRVYNGNIKRGNLRTDSSLGGTPIQT